MSLPCTTAVARLWSPIEEEKLGVSIFLRNVEVQVSARGVALHDGGFLIVVAEGAGVLGRGLGRFFGGNWRIARIRVCFYQCQRSRIDLFNSVSAHAGSARPPFFSRR